MYYIYRLYIWYLSMTLLFFYKEVDENGLLRNHDAIVYRAGRCPKYVVGAPFPSPMAYRCSHEPRSSGAGPDRRGTYVQATSHHTRSIWMAQWLRLIGWTALIAARAGPQMALSKQNARCFLPDRDKRPCYLGHPLLAKRPGRWNTLDQLQQSLYL